MNTIMRSLEDNVLSYYLLVEEDKGLQNKEPSDDDRDCGEPMTEPLIILHSKGQILWTRRIHSTNKTTMGIMMNLRY